MNTGPTLYKRLDMPWKSTCRAIFGRERYLQVKQAVINGIAAKLEQEKDFSRGIYNFG